MQPTNSPPRFADYEFFILADGEIFPQPLPKRVRSCDAKGMFEVNLDAMHLPSNGVVKVLRLQAAAVGLLPSTAECFYAAVIDAIDGRRKTSTVYGWINCWSLFLRKVRAVTDTNIGSITLSMYQWGTKSWGSSQKKLLQGLLKFWTQRSYPGLAHDLKSFLRTSKVPKPRSTTEVQATEISERPFTLVRVREITMSVETLYMTGEFDPQDNLLWRLIISEALRPSQLALLQVQDVVELSVEGWKGVELNVAMVKLHAAPARSRLITVTVADAVATALRDHLIYMRATAKKDLLPHQPLFAVTKKPAGIKAKPLDITGLIARSRMKISGGSSDLNHTDLFCRRFKHTKLTHLAMLGAPVEVLARAAFHSSVGSLKYYINFTDERFAEYEDKLSNHHESIDHAFRGTLVAEGEQTQNSESNLILDASMIANVGACEGVPCDVLAPIGCYACPHFQAFIDGPHEKVLDHLLEDRKRAEDMQLPIETVSREDYLIAAVRQVIHSIKIIQIHSEKR